MVYNEQQAVEPAHRRVMTMLRWSVCVLVAVCVRGAPEPAPVELVLRGTLPALHGKPVMEYHVPVGVSEAARILAAETGRPGQEGQAEGRPEGMIVGGLASYRGEHKFMTGLVISLTSGGTSVCGGSLVSATRVLTAASCYWDGVSTVYSMLAVLGSVTLFSGGERVYATTVVMHGGYNPAVIADDIALLTVPYQYTTAYVKPIAMASGSEQFAGYRAEAVGYGRTSDSAPITTSASLRDVFVDVLSNVACGTYYGGLVTSRVICSSGAGGRNPCGGDQGGPLILYSSAGDDLLLGVFSFGSTSGCSAGLPSGYGRVSAYYSWIVANL